MTRNVITSDVGDSQDEQVNKLITYIPIHN